MASKKKGTSQVVVTIQKKVSFPTGVLNKANKFSDAQNKAYEQLIAETNELIRVGRSPIDAFQFTAESNLRIKSNTVANPAPERVAMPRGHVHIYDAAHHLAKLETEALFGQLDPEVNPDIYIEMNYDDDDDNEEPREFSLREDVEEHFNARHRFYRDQLTNLLPR